MTVPSYRDLASENLGKAANIANEIPTGRVTFQEVEARSAHARAVAAIAMVQALLEIGDVLREALAPTRSES